MTKDEVFREGKQYGLTLDRRTPLAQMLAKLQAHRGYAGERPTEGDPAVGPRRPRFLRNKITGKVWPYDPQWATNPDLEPYEEP